MKTTYLTKYYIQKYQTPWTDWQSVGQVMTALHYYPQVVINVNTVFYPIQVSRCYSQHQQRAAAAAAAAWQWTMRVLSHHLFSPTSTPTQTRFYISTHLSISRLRTKLRWIITIKKVIHNSNYVHWDNVLFLTFTNSALNSLNTGKYELS